MISFLSPLALWAAVLLAVPVLVHLFKPRKVRRTPFSSLRWLHLSQQKLSRRLQWHQVLLFILRAAFVALLVLALARPVFSRDPKAGGGGGPVERFVILDTSRSMGYRPPGAAARSPLDAGKEVAAGLIRGGMAGDRAAVLLSGSASMPSLGPLSHDASVQLAALERVQAAASDADLAAALRLVRPMLAARRSGAAVELDVITDNTQVAWRQAAVTTFAAELGVAARVRVVDVGLTSAQNAWVADARLLPPAKPGAAPAVRVRLGCVGEAGQSRVVRVGGIRGLPDVTRNVKIEPNRPTQLAIPLAGGVDVRGQVARISIEPGDALNDDDEFFLSLEPPDATKVLLVEPDVTRVESMRPGFHLRTALAALAAADGRAIDVTTREPGGVAPADFDDTLDAIVLADVPRLSDAAVQALEARVKSGVGLAIFLGPNVEPAFYNEKLHRPARASDGLLAAPLGAVAEARSRRLEPLTDIRWSHPLVAGLHDPVLGDLPQTTFRSYYEFQAPPAESDIVASIGGGTAAIVDRAVGGGRVVLFNTTANDAWGDLPRRKSFVPLVDRLLSRLTGGAGAGARRSFEAGETVTLPLPGVPADAAVTVVTPGGQRRTPAVYAEGRRTVMRLEGVESPGIYRVESPPGAAATQTFVVQAGRGDSVLTPVDPESLRKWWAPLEVEIVTPATAIAAARSGHGRVALWPMLVAIACLIFVAEMFLVHWLCPRMNPGIVAPVVARRGLFRTEATGAPQDALAN